MAVVEVPVKSLSDLRLEADMTLDEVASALAAHLGEASRSHVSVFQIEKRGTEKLPVLVALSEIYGVERIEVEAAAAETKRRLVAF